MAYRTISIPVAEVVEGGTKIEFYKELRKTLDASRIAANICFTTCFANDKELFQGGKYPKQNIYKAINGMFPGVTSCAANLSRSVEKEYVQKRFKIRIGQVSIPNVRSYPWPLLHNKGNKTMTVNFEDERILVKLRLLNGTWVVRLRQGSNYRDQIRTLRRATIGDSKIWIDRRRHFANIGFSCDIPSEKWAGKGTLKVASHRDHLLVAMKERDHTPFVINGDVIKSWSVERDKRYQRLRQDRKAGQKRAANEKLKLAGDKYNNRVQTFVHTCTREIVNYAKRRKVNKIVLDCTIKSYIKNFPWHLLTSMLQYKCVDAGLEFEEQTLASETPNLNKAHVYFRYSPVTHKVKIGCTKNSRAREKKAKTDCPDDETVIIAVYNTGVKDLKKTEKYFHSYFNSSRLHGEWFEAESVIAWLRDSGWFGNTGNISEIAQVLDVNTSKKGDLHAHGERLNGPVIQQPLVECV